MKGASGNIGANRLQSLSQELEAATHTAAVETVETALAAVVAEEENIREAVRQQPRT